MGNAKTARLIWWLFVTTVFLLCSLGPLIWRTEGSIWLMVLFCPPIGIALLVLTLVLLVRQKSLWPWQGTAGLLIMTIGIAVGVYSDDWARRWMFEAHYASYLEVVEMGKKGLLPDGPVPQEIVSRTGAYAIRFEKRQGILKIETICGPSLETTVYSPKPLSRPRLRPIKKATGCWYFQTE